MNLGVLQHRYDTNATTTGLRLLRQKSADELNNRILLGRRSSLVLDLVVFTSKLKKKKKNRGDDINHLLRSRGGEVEGDRLPTATGHSCPPASLRACPAGTPRPRRPRTTTTRRGPAAAGAGASTGSPSPRAAGSPPPGYFFAESAGGAFFFFFFFLRAAAMASMPLACFFAFGAGDSTRRRGGAEVYCLTFKAWVSPSQSI
jgi:hypothetical protein